MNLELLLERAYVQPDPEYPLPRIRTAHLLGIEQECSDDNQLERWRVANPGPDEWMVEIGESPDSWGI